MNPAILNYPQIIKTLLGNSEEKLMYGYGDNENVTIRPNVTSWKKTSTTKIYNVCQNMTNSNNIHGLNKVDSVTTMMQNTQWGAVAYLAQSEYGNMQTKDEESGIWNNSYNEGVLFKRDDIEGNIYNRAVNLTGMAGDTRDSSTEYNSDVKNKNIKEDSIEITYEKLNGQQYTKNFWRYYTKNGKKASTTRNIYGIYDMAGGAWEYTASYLENATINPFVNDFLGFSKKYQTRYKGNGKTDSIEDSNENYEANKDKYGDAMWETSNNKNQYNSWNKDSLYTLYYSGPFILRGGTCFEAETTGIFSFSRDHGLSNVYVYAFRVVLI